MLEMSGAELLVRNHETGELMPWRVWQPHEVTVEIDDG